MRRFVYMGPTDQDHGERWLDLSEAARYLGVHFTTLRRWADAGEVPCIRTPGGRRRFCMADLERFMLGLRQPVRALAVVPLETRLEARALNMAREELRTQYATQAGSLPRFGEEARARFKDSGQKLLGLLIQFGSRADTGEAFLEEAKRLAADYGALCCQAGMTVSDTVRTFLFFGHSMLNTVQQAGAATAAASVAANGPHDEEGYRLYQRMNVFLDTVLLATVESYCGAQPATAATSPGSAVAAVDEGGKTG